MSKAVEVFEGARVLMSYGPAVVVSIERHGITVKDSLGENHFVRADKLAVAGLGEDGMDAVHLSLQPWWNSLTPAIRAETLLKLEVVLEVLTAHRDGHPLMAREGEPFYPFGEGFGVSLTKRVEAMARQLTFEYGVDRARMRRLLAGEIVRNSVSPNAIRGWIKDFKREGLRGLVDGRKTKGRQGFEVIDPRFVRIVDEELAIFDGTRSILSLVEIERRILVRLKHEGIDDIDLPQRITQQYLSTRMAALGHTPKQHKSSTLRENSSRRNYPATHPGHFAVDVTRCDNLVWDDVYERAYSVEVVTIISVPTRVVAACRVVPRSANSLEIALALYDAIRPFSMVVDGTTIEDFRWCGIPTSLDFGDNPISAHASRVRTDREVNGRHVKPGITPISLRADNGAIFLSGATRALLQDWGVDLMPSRPGRPLDNGIVESWHDRLQAAYQSFANGAGFKGRAVHERGRFVGWVGFEPLGSWRDLRQHMHRFHCDRLPPQPPRRRQDPRRRGRQLHPARAARHAPGDHRETPGPAAPRPDLQPPAREVADTRQWWHRLPRADLRQRRPGRDPWRPSWHIPRKKGEGALLVRPARPTEPGYGTAAATTTASTSSSGGTPTSSMRP